MKTRSLVLSSLVLVLACDKVERDWSRCSDKHADCRQGYSCLNNLCVPHDAGLDVSPALDGATAPAETAVDRPPAVDATADAQDNGSDVDTAVDAPAYPGFDVLVADDARTCNDNLDCPSDLPLCLNSLCVQCGSHDDCRAGGDGGFDDQNDGGDGGVTGGGLCNAQHRCVGCLSHADCRDPDKPVCGDRQECVACADFAARANACEERDPALPACDATTGRCEQCVRTSDCRAKSGDAGTGDAGQQGGGGVCSTEKTCVECSDSTDCMADPARGFCNEVNVCVGCNAAGDDACTGAKPLCATSGDKAGQCVECTDNAHCLRADQPICGSNQCRACKKDSECSASAGVCALDGSCPMANVIVHVQNVPKCTPSGQGQGTIDSPYCDLNGALSNIGSNSVIRIIGTVTASAGLLINPTRPLLITGQSAATAIVKAAPENAGPVVSITGGEVTLRDLTISGGQAAGISASAGKVHVSRCYVIGNAGTGIVVGNGVAFDIANTVVANNGGTTGAGVSLGSYTGTSPVRFAFNTIVDNGLGGVVCAAGPGHTLTGILAHNNGVRDFNDNCITDATSSTAPPAFGSNYHLTANSPCVNGGGSACSADHDIDGESRPKGNACDCGADEF